MSQNNFKIADILVEVFRIFRFTKEQITEAEKDLDGLFKVAIVNDLVNDLGEKKTEELKVKIKDLDHVSLEKEIVEFLNGNYSEEDIRSKISSSIDKVVADYLEFSMGKATQEQRNAILEVFTKFQIQ